MSLISPNGKMAFVHVPKTGGTSIEHHLKTIGWSGLSRPPYKKKHHVGFHYIKQYNEQLESAVTIVRNPVDFAISYYRFFWNLEINDYKNNTIHNAYKYLTQLQEGFMKWFFDHAPHHKRWCGVHTPQRYVLGTLEDDLTHTKVFDYKKRDDFWQFTIGKVPDQEYKLHRLDHISPVYIEGSDRKKILDFYKIDMDQWAEQFDWR